MGSHLLNLHRTPALSDLTPKSVWKLEGMMNASKRKFHALLSNFGNKSTSSLSSKSGVKNGSNVDLEEGELKRRRINRPTSALTQPSTHANPTPSLPSKTTSMAHNKSLSLASAGPALTDSPKYAPWDRVAFLKRLESFKSVTDWMPKPAKVNEVEWAKRGWVCRGQERVRCELCNVEILVKLNVKEVDGEEERVLNASEIEHALVEKYAQLIITSHAETCLWKQRGCDDTIFKLPLNHAPTTLHAIRERYDALCSISDRLPYVHNLHPPAEFDLDTILSYLPKNFFASPIINAEPSKPSSQDEVNRVAITMALFGWTARPETKIRDGAAVCEVCFRTLGLWLFKSKEVNEVGEVIRTATMNYLDPVEQHREYCPWKNAKSQNATGSSSKSPQAPELAAWQVIARVLRNDQRLRNAGKDSKKDRSQSITADAASRPGTAPETDFNDEDAESIREDKDKERWARLRRVKSLFDTKAVKKLHRNSASLDVNSKSPKAGL